MDLDATYRWFEDEVTRPSASPPRPRRATAPGPDELITPSSRLTAAQRLGIYADAYFLRLRDVLAGDFVSLVWLLGDETFSELARRYLTACPSESYSLNFLGDRLPEWLEGAEGLEELTVDSQRREGVADAAGTPLCRELLVDLARVELAMSQVVDRPEVSPLDSDALARLDLSDAETLRLSTVPALELIACRHAVNPTITAARHEEAELPSLSSQPSWVVVCRQDYVVARIDLSHFEFELLSCLRSGATLADSIERAAATPADDTGDAAEAVFLAFQKLVAEGLLCR